MAEQPTLGRMGQQFTDPLDSLLRCATMLWNHDSSLRVVWILFFSPYSSGTLFATPFSIVTLLFALCEPCLNKYVTNRLLRGFANLSHSPFAIIRHVGRRSGKPYETVIWVWPQGEGFVIAITYGPEVDWY